jgi:hypothetical protein
MVGSTVIGEGSLRMEVPDGDGHSYGVFVRIWPRLFVPRVLPVEPVYTPELMSAHHTSPLRPHGEDLLRVSSQYRPKILFLLLPLQGRPLRSLLCPPRHPSRLSHLSLTACTIGFPYPARSSPHLRVLSIIILSLRLDLSRRTRRMEGRVRSPSRRMAPAECGRACACRG